MLSTGLQGGGDEDQHTAVNVGTYRLADSVTKVGEYLT